MLPQNLAPYLMEREVTAGRWLSRDDGERYFTPLPRRPYFVKTPFEI